MLDKKEEQQPSADWKVLCDQLEIEIGELPQAVRDVIPDESTSSVEEFERECARRASGTARMNGSDVALVHDAQTRLLASGLLLSKLGRRAPDPVLMVVLKMIGEAQCSLAAIIHREIPSDAKPEYTM
jgi:hypothetical protein